MNYIYMPDRSSVSCVKVFHVGVKHPAVPFPSGRMAATTKCNIAEIESLEGCSSRCKLGSGVSRTRLCKGG